MNPLTIAAIIFACIFGAALLAMRLRSVLPEHHLSTDTKDTVKLAMGLVAPWGAGARSARRFREGRIRHPERRGGSDAGKIAFLDRHVVITTGRSAGPRHGSNTRSKAQSLASGEEQSEEAQLAPNRLPARCAYEAIRTSRRKTIPSA